VKGFGWRCAGRERDVRDEESKPGALPHFCSIHLKMTGKITVP